MSFSRRRGTSPSCSRRSTSPWTSCWRRSRYSPRASTSSRYARPHAALLPQSPPLSAVSTRLTPLFPHAQNSYIKGYFIKDPNEEELFSFIQANLEATSDLLMHAANEAVGDGKKVMESRDKIIHLTNVTKKVSPLRSRQLPHHHRPPHPDYAVFQQLPQRVRQGREDETHRQGRRVASRAVRLEKRCPLRSDWLPATIATVDGAHLARQEDDAQSNGTRCNQIKQANKKNFPLFAVSLPRERHHSACTSHELSTMPQTPPNYQLYGKISGHTGTISFCSFSPSGELLAIACITHPHGQQHRLCPHTRQLITRSPRRAFAQPPTAP